ncbi:MAG TPA: nuclear transport factor 2 family protein [Bacteroidota bacterium]
MRHVVMLLSFVVLLSPNLFSQTKTPKVVGDSASVKEVMERIATYRVALIQKDVKKLDSIWGDEYLFTNASGVLVTKAERIANLKSGATALDSIVPNEDQVHVRVYGNVAVVKSHVFLKGQYSGQSTADNFRSMHVWVKRKGSWQLVANQLTRVAKP